MSIRRKTAVTAAAGVLAAITASVATTSVAADRTARALPASVEALRLAEPVTGTGMISRVDPALLNASGTQRVLVRLREMPAARAAEESSSVDPTTQRERVRQQQWQFRGRAARHAPGARVLGQVENVLNGMFMEVNAAQIRALAADPAVERVTRVIDYQLDLSETVPYVRQAEDGRLRFTGKGITVAVLDSGIDYTHEAFGGPGTVEFYDQCYAQRDVAPSGECA